jgi:sulfide:quinone oxidoreductase
MSGSRASSSPLKVLIAGGGVAAAELMLALRDLAGERTAVELLTPNREFVYRPLAVAAPFDIGVPFRFDLQAIADEQGAGLRAGMLAAVDVDRHRALTGADSALPYDVLAIAVGARPRDVVPGALTLTGVEAFSAYRELLGRLGSGEVDRLVFAVPSGVTWALPLYELALMTRTWLRARGPLEARLTFVTPESAPLAAFGERGSTAVRALLEEQKVDLLTDNRPLAFEDRALALEGGFSLACDAVVALPVLDGPAIPGLPQTGNGFIPVDDHGSVIGASDVYAAGDATSTPIKQGGLATQQADAVADAIAARAGVELEPQPFDPVLRGLLLTGNIPQYLRAKGVGGADDSAASFDPLWWPPTKIAGEYLSHYVARLSAREAPRPDAVWLRLETDDLEPFFQPPAAA